MYATNMYECCRSGGGLTSFSWIKPPFDPNNTISLFASFWKIKNNKRRNQRDS